MDQRKDWHLSDVVSHELGQGDPFAAAVRATRMPMVITNPRLADNPIVFCNEAFQALTGYGRAEVIGRNCRFLQGPATDGAEVRRVREAIAAGLDVEAELLNYRKDGSTFWNALYLSPVREETGEIGFFFASQLDVSERVLAEKRAVARREEVEHEVALRTADLAQALAAKTLLLHELDHRVKNNLMMVSSLLRLEARAAGDGSLATPLTAMLQRVEALGAVHRRLFQTGDLMRFDVGAYLRDLAADVVSAFGSRQIRLESDIEPVEVASNAASALGLVLNEMLTRAVARGFDGRTGTLRISARSEGDMARVEIDDDNPHGGWSAPDGLGDRLIQRLSKQVGLEMAASDLSPGSRVTMTFPLEAR